MAVLRRAAAREAARQQRAQLLDPQVAMGTQIQQAREVGEMLASGRLTECVRVGLAPPYNPFRHAYAAACEMRLGHEPRAREICRDLRTRNPPATALGYCNAANLR